MEGGNWRIKSGLKVPYRDVVSVEARTVLLAVADSAKTFGGGRPCESFAHRYGCFEYSSVMAVAGKDRDKGRDRDISSGRGRGRGGGSDSSGDHAASHTEEFVLWLNASLLRARQRRERREKALEAPTTTN